MKFGLFAINYGTCGDPEIAVEVARQAESAGFESVWTGEHVALPSPQPADFSIAPSVPFLDTIVALTLVATHTTKLKVGSGIIVLPLHNPVLLAKALASVDVVSRGRLIVGVGTGYLPVEFGAAGVSLAGRGERVDDYIRALRSLWEMPAPRYDGKYASFSGIDAYPRPVQVPGPPLVVGGESRAALRRAIVMGNGWYGFYLDPPTTERYVRSLRDLASEVERPAELGPLEITVTPSGALDRRAVDQYENAGVDRLVLLPQPDAPSRERHRPVPFDQIKQNIEIVGGTLIGR